MKTVDIEIGQSYVYLAYKADRDGKRAEVLEKGVLRTAYSPSAWRDVTRNDGIKVLLHQANGESSIAVLRSAELYGPWDEYAAARAVAQAQAIEARDNAIDERAQRGKIAMDLIVLLAAAGIEPVVVTQRIHAPIRSNRTDTQIAFEAVDAGFAVTNPDGTGPKVITAYPGVYSYWLTGCAISLTAEQIFALAGQEV